MNEQTTRYNDYLEDPFFQKLTLVTEFQRRARTFGILVECDAFRDSIRLRGRIVKVTETEIRLRLCEPCYWRIRLSTWSEWRYQGYQPFTVDLEKETVEVSEWARMKVEYMLKLAWIRVKHSDSWS